ncbi:MAG: GerW family sporulation protein [Clostridiales bacterium]|nr:GerW family sporulation protein [Clostridiales bacterium]
MEKKHPLNEVIDITIDKVKQMVDVNTVVGQPIHTPEGVTVIPISRMSFGFGSGGSDWATKNQPADKDNAFGGGAGAGVSVEPTGFLIIKSESVRFLPVAPCPGGPVEKVIDLMPEIVDRVENFVDKRKAEKAEKADAEKAEQPEEAASEE